jgi:REP element-mobilizing transposase RayT
VERKRNPSPPHDGFRKNSTQPTESRRVSRVGWVERSETHHHTDPIDGQLSAQFPSRRQLFLYGEPGGPAIATPHGTRRRPAYRVSQRRGRHPFTVEAIVVLPDHLHTVWTLPEGDADFPVRWRLIKATFSRALPRTEPLSNSRTSKGERGIWQRRYWEHTLRDEDDSRATSITSISTGQAWPCGAGTRLAVFILPSHGAARFLSRGLGGQGRG